MSATPPPAGHFTLTARGRGVLLAAAGLLLAARLFGSAELAGLGAAAIVAVAAAAVLVGRAPLTYRGERWLAPTRVGAGGDAQAQVRFTNTGARPTTLTAVATDPVAAPAGTAPAGRRPTAAGSSGGCLIPPLAAGAMAEAAWALPVGRRGVATVGPLRISMADPLGLVERRIEAAGEARLVVHPRIHAVPAPPGSAVGEVRHGSARPVRVARGDDFFALREYEVGDDLRRVHWRSTARHGDLMLRQDEQRVGEVATVLLDTRASAHTAGSFERALEVAASVTAALVADGRRLRFMTTGGFDVAYDGARAVAGGHAEPRWAAVLEHLALLEPALAGSTGDALGLALHSIRRQPAGPLTAVLGRLTATELTALNTVAPRLGLVLAVRCDDGNAEPGAGTSRGKGPAGSVVVVPAADLGGFADAWTRAVATPRRAPARR